LNKPIVLLGEARGEAEHRLNTSFVGPSGAELLRQLSESGVISLSSIDRDYINRFYSNRDSAAIESVWSLHPEVYRTNVFNQHPPRNDLEHFCGPKSTAIADYSPLLKSKYVRTEFQFELDRLADELISHDPNLVICLGNTAVWAMTGKTGITKSRGTTMLSTHTAADFKILPTYHPAAVLRQWELRPTVIADLIKAAKESQFPEIRRPEREIWIEPSLEDIEKFIKEQIMGCDLLSVDIETIGTRITCIGFAPSAKVGIVIPFDDERAKGRCYWSNINDERKAWRLIKSVLEDASIPKLFQNGMYDIAFLWRAYGIKTLGAAEDTMLLSHALHPESLKGLGYLGSIYSDEGAWKHMRKKHETIKRDD
jgi:uracil-DNA glycosylase family 4